MITIKSKTEIDKMRVAGRIVYEALCLIEKNIVAGVSTLELNNIARKHIIESRAIPSFENYNGFPYSVCISVNEELIHGIPSVRCLNNGDIVSVDIGACFEGYHADAARTFGVGTVSGKAQRLIDVTKQSFFEGLKYMREGYRIKDISCNIQRFVEGNGYSVERVYCGHGIGTSLHEAPEIPNYETNKGSARIVAGMTIAVEPMVIEGKKDIRIAEDKWTVISKDKSLTAHYENTVLITKGEPQILTMPN